MKLYYLYRNQETVMNNYLFICSYSLTRIFIYFLFKVDINEYSRYFF